MRHGFPRVPRSLLVAAVALSACKKPPAGSDVRASREPARPSDGEARRHLMDVLSRLDYLPVLYGNDYCFARSFITSMALASRGIPSAQLVAVASDLSGLSPRSSNGSIVWSWHIVPVVQLPLAKEPVLVDKAIRPRGDGHSDPTTLWTIVDWVGQMTTGLGTSHVNLGVVPATSYGANAGEAVENLPTGGKTIAGGERQGEYVAFDLSAQQPYDVAIVNQACDDLIKNSDMEVRRTNDTEKLFAVRNRLKEDIVPIAQRLEVRGKLALPTDGKSTFLCGADVLPLQGKDRDAEAAKARAEDALFPPQVFHVRGGDAGTPGRDLLVKYRDERAVDKYLGAYREARRTRAVTPPSP